MGSCTSAIGEKHLTLQTYEGQVGGFSQRDADETQTLAESVA